MESSTVISIIALIVSILSAASSIWFGFRDRARLKAVFRYFPPAQNDEGPFGPPLLQVEIANHGRRDVYLEYFYVGYGGSRGLSIIETTWENDIHGRCKLGEGDKYTHTFDPDSDGILVNEDGIPATRLYFQDSLSRRYKVKDTRRNIQTYLNVSGNF